jgi:hypothetical protein
MFKLGGWLALLLSLAASIAANGWSFGPVEWISMVSVTDLALVLVLSYAPRIAASSGLVLILAASLVILS